MGVTLTIRRDDGTPELRVPICGWIDLQEKWLPRCNAMNLDLLKSAFTGGLSVGEYHEELLRQVTAILADFETEFGPADEVAELGVFRCARLLRLLKENPSSSKCFVYLG